MATVQELDRPVEAGVQQPQPESTLSERPVNPELETLESDRQELGEFIKAVPDPTQAQSVVGDDGERILDAGIADVVDLSLPQEDLKPNKWYHFHKPIIKALVWIVETILRRDKKEAVEQNSNL